MAAPDFTSPEAEAVDDDGMDGRGGCLTGGGGTGFCVAPNVGGDFFDAGGCVAPQGVAPEAAAAGGGVAGGGGCMAPEAAAAGGGGGGGGCVAPEAVPGGTVRN